MQCDITETYIFQVSLKLRIKSDGELDLLSSAVFNCLTTKILFEFKSRFNMMLMLAGRVELLSTHHTYCKIWTLFYNLVIFAMH